MSELKQCPFCGKPGFYSNEDGYDSGNLKTFWVSCECLPVYVKGIPFDIWQSRPIEDALRDENHKLREALESLRQTRHYACEDGYFSCPLADNYFGTGIRECNCGTDERNAIIDNALKGGD